MSLSHRVSMACGIFLTTLAAVGLAGSATSFGDHAHVTKQFSGPKANRGTAKGWGEAADGVGTRLVSLPEL
jgi:hypothetical protein